MSAVMDLTDYIKSKGGTVKADCPILAHLAGKAGCAPTTLYMVALGHKKAGPKLAISIEEATGREVARSSVRPDYWPTVSAA